MPRCEFGGVWAGGGGGGMFYAVAATMEAQWLVAGGV